MQNLIMECFPSTTSDLCYQRKLVIVGDGACGKTCLLTVFCQGVFPKEKYIPTVFDNSVKDMEIYDRPAHVELWDTAGQEDFDRLRTLSYPDSNGILLAFSVDFPEAIENIYEKWVPEIRQFCPGLPITLVGCKTDLRQDEKTINKLKKYSKSIITEEQGQEIARNIGAYAYVECSALLGVGVNNVFNTSLESTVIRKKKTRSCNIM